MMLFKKKKKKKNFFQELISNILLLLKFNVVKYLNFTFSNISILEILLPSK